ncbi:MAG: ATP-binding protein [Muribaculaceae bacterium]|nr:ATP-binding protein [Muribaculaceae bacterium]
MLTNVSITNLFNLYSYDLDLKAKESSVCFITGPNGYGKTTILNIIDDIYSGRWTDLCDVCFKSVCLSFSDNISLSVARNCEIAQEDGSDELITGDVSLNVNFQLAPGAEYSFNVKKSSEQEVVLDKNVELFFDSHPVYYIRDGRLYSKDRIPTINRCVDSMRDFLKDSSLAETKSFIEKIDVFNKIIEMSDFADKTMQIDRRYGFRFVLNNEEGTILTPDSLSSGEQHLTVMAFELLFMAPDDSLVLIDEPEISFHMLWQVDFLKKLEMILGLRKLQCIVATHSPQIFNMKWKLSVDLFTQSGLNR